MPLHPARRARALERRSMRQAERWQRVHPVRRDIPGHARAPARERPRRQRLAAGRCRAQPRSSAAAARLHVSPRGEPCPAPRLVRKPHLRCHGGRMPRPSRTRPTQARRTLRATAALDAPSAHAPDATHPGVPAAVSNSLPPEVARRAQREMDRLRRLPTGSPEAAQVRAYLQWLWSTPWETSAGEDADHRHVQAELEQEHLGLTKAKERILEYLAVRRLKRDLPGPAPGAGGRRGRGRLARGAEGALPPPGPFGRVTVRGRWDAAELVGEPRTLPGADPQRG